MPSLKKSLMPSASVIRTPRGPARIGPTRVCMSAITLRSIQIRSITRISSAKKTTTTRATSSSQSSQSIRRPPRRPRARASASAGSIRTAVVNDPLSSSFAASPGWLNGTNAAPSATCSVTRTSSTASPASVVTVARPPSTRPRLSASSGWSSTNGSCPRAALSSSAPSDSRPSSTSSGYDKQGELAQPLRASGPGPRGRARGHRARLEQGCGLRPERLEVLEPERPPHRLGQPREDLPVRPRHAGGATDGVDRLRPALPVGGVALALDPRGGGEEGVGERLERAELERLHHHVARVARAPAGPGRRPGRRGAGRRRSGTGRRSRGSRTPRGSAGSSARVPREGSPTIPRSPRARPDRSRGGRRAGATGGRRRGGPRDRRRGAGPAPSGPRTSGRPSARRRRPADAR